MCALRGPVPHRRSYRISLISSLLPLSGEGEEILIIAIRYKELFGRRGGKKGDPHGAMETRRGRIHRHVLARVRGLRQRRPGVGRRPSGVNQTFGVSRPVVGAWLILAALLLSCGDDGWGASAQADPEPPQPEEGRSPESGRPARPHILQASGRPAGKRGPRRCAKTLSRPASSRFATVML